MADEIRTERLLLRRATMADLDAIHAVLSDPQATRYWSTPPHQDISESEKWLRSMVDADRSVSDDFIVEYQGRVLGKVGCWRLPEVGFILAPDCWGKGIASEALRAYLERRRAIGTLAVISADVDPRNMRYWSSEPHVDIEQSRAWLKSMVEANPADSDDYVIEREGTVIGKLGCWKLPEIGFMIAADATGRGYAGEAMGAFLERRRAMAEPRRLVADVDPRNAPSLALLKRHGFVETGRATGTWTVGGEVCDSIYLALDL